MRAILHAATVSLLLPAAASAAIITDGNVSLGINDFGHLNVYGGVADVAGQTAVGVRWISPSDDQYEATSHGCLCEGWGVLADGASGYASVANGGSGGLTLDSFTETATTATSVVSVTGSGVKVTHDFALSASDDLYRVRVTIANTGTTDIAAVTYRRAMDWDTSPTPFNEFVTIAGTGTTTLLEESSNDGFENVNLASTPNLTGISPICPEDADFTACGPGDHGAAFDFALGSIAAGESYAFDIFYGGAANLTDALTALGTVGAELYSMGWSGTDADQNGFSDDGALTPTFIFAFKGVGGAVIVPPPDPTPSAVPLPAAGWLLLAGMGGLAAMGRRRKAA